MALPVLVVGGTGNTGSAVVAALSKSGVSTRVLSRDPDTSRAKALAALPGVTVQRGDLADPGTFRDSALEGVRAVFVGCANTKEQVQLEKNLIDAASASETCEYLVKLGTCGVENYTSEDSPIEYGRMHSQIEAHLSASSMKWTVLRPNYFMQNHMGDIFGTLPKNLVVYPMAPSATARVVDTRDIGDVAAALLRLDDATPHHGQFYDVCGPESVSTQDMAALYSKSTGRDVVAIQVPPEDWAKAAEEAGFPEWLAAAVATGMETYWGTGKMDYPSSDAVLQLCPPQRTMSQWISEHIALSPPPAP